MTPSRHCSDSYVAAGLDPVTWARAGEPKHGHAVGNIDAQSRSRPPPAAAVAMVGNAPRRITVIPPGGISRRQPVPRSRREARRPVSVIRLRVVPRPTQGPCNLRPECRDPWQIVLRFGTMPGLDAIWC
jgi:hypothetical protein